MPTPINFNRSFEPAYGSLVPVTPLVRRLVAHNPSAFTAWGSGTYVVGRGAVAVIDPGPDDATHIGTLLRELGEEKVAHIVVTHTHIDHSPGARILQARTGAKITGCGPHARIGAHDEPVEEGGDFEHNPDRLLHDGDSVTGAGWTLTAVHTPGHTSNHLCYALAEESALFSGDHVMGWSTTVVSPPDGDMNQYMASLEKCLARDDRVLYPTHGAPITEPKPFIMQLIAHRREREEQILATLNTGPVLIPEMVAKLYAEIDPRLHKAAGRSVLAHLIALVDSGRARCDGTPGAASQYRLP